MSDDQTKAGTPAADEAEDDVVAHKDDILKDDVLKDDILKDDVLKDDIL